MKYLLALLVVLFVSVPGLAAAQGTDVTGSVDANEIELGDVVTYTMQASSSSGGGFADPKLSVPAGLTLVDSSQSPSHMVSVINGRMTEKQGLNVTWVLRSDRLGTFSIGPAMIMVGGVKKSVPAQRVSVVAPGAGRKKPRRGNPFDPFGSGFDPFKGLFPQVDDEPPDPFGGISTDPKLGLPSERAPVAFLHATVDKTHVVVGEQVTLTVYLYEDLHSRQNTRVSDVHEATANDFVKRTLLADETRATQVGNAIIGGRAWAVKLVRKNALFPIKAGKLDIGPMSLTLLQMKAGLRESETVQVDVAEPPLPNRPPGYQIGDTGDFSISASLTPRQAPQHGAIGVSVELRGTGNMPATLPTPEIAGVEWLEPQTRDALGPQSSEKYGGTRTFNYVVRLHKAGAIDLGEIRLPYWDPDKRAYNVARASLGIVSVSPEAARAAGAPDVALTEILPGLPKARLALEGPHAQSFVTERPVYWGALFGAPLACVLGIILTGAIKKSRAERAAAAPSPERIARDRRGEAEAALRGTDGKAAIAAVARALEADVLARTGVNVRGTSREEALRELEDAGVSATDAKELLATLAACEDARFSPTDIAIDEARSLEARAKHALAPIGKS